MSNKSHNETLRRIRSFRETQQKSREELLRLEKEQSFRVKYKSHTKDKRNSKLSDQVDRMLIHAKISQNPSLMKSLEHDQDPEKVAKERRKHNALRKVNENNQFRKGKGNLWTPTRDIRDINDSDLSGSMDKQEMIENEMKLALQDLDEKHKRAQLRRQRSSSLGRSKSPSARYGNEYDNDNHQRASQSEREKELLWSFLDERSMISNANNSTAKSFLNRSLNFKTMLSLNDNYDSHHKSGDKNEQRERDEKTPVSILTSSTDSPVAEGGYYELKQDPSAFYDNENDTATSSTAGEGVAPSTNKYSGSLPRKSLTIDTNTSTLQSESSLLHLLAEPDAIPVNVLCDCMFLAGPSHTDLEALFVQAQEVMTSKNIPGTPTNTNGKSATTSRKAQVAAAAAASAAASQDTPLVSTTAEPKMLYTTSKDPELDADLLPFFCFPAGVTVNIKQDVNRDNTRFLSSLASPSLRRKSAGMTSSSNNITNTSQNTTQQPSPSTPSTRPVRNFAFLLSNHISSQYGVSYIFTKRYTDKDKSIIIEAEYCMCAVTKTPFLCYLYHILNQFERMGGMDLGRNGVEDIWRVHPSDTNMTLQLELRLLNELASRLAKTRLPVYPRMNREFVKNFTSESSANTDHGREEDDKMPSHAICRHSAVHVNILARYQKRLEMSFKRPYYAPLFSVINGRMEKVLSDFEKELGNHIEHNLGPFDSTRYETQVVHSLAQEKDKEASFHILNWALPILLKSLRLDQIILALGCALSEMKIVVLSSDPTVMSGCLLALTHLLRPLKWCGNVVVTLPDFLNELLESPIFFMMGMTGLPTGFNLPRGLVVIDPNDGVVHLHPQDVVASHTLNLPHSNKLLQILKPLADQINSISDVNQQAVKHEQEIAQNIHSMRSLSSLNTPLTLTLPGMGGTGMGGDGVGTLLPSPVAHASQVSYTPLPLPPELDTGNDAQGPGGNLARVICAFSETVYYHIRKMVRIAVSRRLDKKMGSHNTSTTPGVNSPESPATSYASFRSFGSTSSMFGGSSQSDRDASRGGRDINASSHLSADNSVPDDASRTLLQSTRRRTDSTLRDYRTLLLTQDREELLALGPEPYSFTEDDLGKSGDTFIDRLLDTQSFSNYCYDYSQKGLGNVIEDIQTSYTRQFAKSKERGRLRSISSGNGPNSSSTRSIYGNEFDTRSRASSAMMDNTTGKKEANNAEGVSGSGGDDRIPLSANIHEDLFTLLLTGKGNRLSTGDRDMEGDYNDNAEYAIHSAASSPRGTGNSPGLFSEEGGEGVHTEVEGEEYEESRILWCNGRCSGLANTPSCTNICLVLWAKRMYEAKEKLNLKNMVNRHNNSNADSILTDVVLEGGEVVRTKLPVCPQRHPRETDEQYRKRCKEVLHFGSPRPSTSQPGGDTRGWRSSYSDTHVDNTQHYDEHLRASRSKPSLRHKRSKSRDRALPGTPLSGSGTGISAPVTPSRDTPGRRDSSVTMREWLNFKNAKSGNQSGDGYGSCYQQSTVGTSRNTAAMNAILSYHEARLKIAYRNKVHLALQVLKPFLDIVKHKLYMKKISLKLSRFQAIVRRILLQYCHLPSLVLQYREIKITRWGARIRVRQWLRRLPQQKWDALLDRISTRITKEVEAVQSPVRQLTGARGRHYTRSRNNRHGSGKEGENQPGRKRIQMTWAEESSNTGSGGSNSSLHHKTSRTGVPKTLKEKIDLGAKTGIKKMVTTFFQEDPEGRGHPESASRSTSPDALMRPVEGLLDDPLELTRVPSTSSNNSQTSREEAHSSSTVLHGGSKGGEKEKSIAQERLKRRMQSKATSDKVKYGDTNSTGPGPHPSLGGRAFSAPDGMDGKAHGGKPLLDNANEASKILDSSSSRKDNNGAPGSADGIVRQGEVKKENIGQNRMERKELSIDLTSEVDPITTSTHHSDERHMPTTYSATSGSTHGDEKGRGVHVPRSRSPGDLSINLFDDNTPVKGIKDAGTDGANTIGGSNTDDKKDNQVHQHDVGGSSIASASNNNHGNTNADTNTDPGMKLASSSTSSGGTTTTISSSSTKTSTKSSSNGKGLSKLTALPPAVEQELTISISPTSKMVRKSWEPSNKARSAAQGGKESHTTPNSNSATSSTMDTDGDYKRGHRDNGIGLQDGSTNANHQGDDDLFTTRFTRSLGPEVVNVLTSQQMSMVLDMYRILRRGLRILKHTHDTAPHERILYCDADLNILYWLKPDHHTQTQHSQTSHAHSLSIGEERALVRNSKDPRRYSIVGGKTDEERVMQVHDLLDVRDDLESEIMQRALRKSYLSSHCNDDSERYWHCEMHSISIIGHNRSLDFEVKDLNDWGAVLHGAQIVVNYCCSLKKGLSESHEDLSITL